MNIRRKVGCIGMATVDFLRTVESFPLEDSENPVIENHEVIGGPVGRGAITSSRLGAETHLLATCGDGIFAEILKSLIIAEGVNTHLISTKDFQSQHSFILISGDSGKRTTIWTPQPRADDIFLSNIHNFMKGCDCILMDCTDERLSHAVADEALKQNIPTVVDTGSYKPWAEDLFPKITHPISPKKFFTERSPQLTPEEALLLAFQEFKPDTWGLTDGENGGQYLTRKAPKEIHTYSALDIIAIDTCGAGDTFHGAFAYAVANKWPLEKAYDLSSWAAGRKCAVFGNGGIPYFNEMNKRFSI